MGSYPTVSRPLSFVPALFLPHGQDGERGHVSCCGLSGLRKAFEDEEDPLPPATIEQTFRFGNLDPASSVVTMDFSNHHHEKTSRSIVVVWAFGAGTGRQPVGEGASAGRPQRLRTVVFL